MKNNNNIAKKYYSQKLFGVPEILCVTVMAVATVVFTFVRGGGPIGAPIFCVALLALVFLKSSKIKDSEIESELKALLVKARIDLSSKNTMALFDLSAAPIVKGKDGKYRTPFYVVSHFDITADFVTITIYKVDIIRGQIEQSAYGVSLDKGFSLSEENVLTSYGKKSVYYIECDAIKQKIPVKCDDIQSMAIIERLTKA